MHIINREDIISLYQVNKEKCLDYIKNIFKYNYNLPRKNIVTNISDYFNMVPLPSKLKTNNKIHYLNRKYISYKNNNYIIPCNICLPHYSISPIPFSIPYISHNTRIISSNVYYYELTIDSIPFTESWNSMNISIGFGTSNTDISDNILGWTNEGISYNSFDGSISGWKIKDRIYKDFGLGDTVGAGVIYCTDSTYKVFFTLNGEMYSEIIEIKSINKLIPMIGLNYNSMIKINFNTCTFRYNYTVHISPKIISTNNVYIKELNDSKYEL